MSFLVRSTASTDYIPVEELVRIEVAHRFMMPGVGAVQRLSVDPGETGEIVRADHHLTFVRKGVTDLQSRYDGGPQRSQRIHPGCLHIRPAALTHASTWTDPVELTIVSIEEKFLQENACDLLPHVSAAISLRPEIGVRDQFMWHLGARLDQLVRTPAPPTIFVQQIMAAMVMHLVLRRGGKPAAIKPHSLSQKAMRLTKEYVEANLADDIRLATLASLCGLSVFHFSRQFSREMGMGIGRYVQVRKMRRAAELLIESTLSIPDVGAVVGYRDGSSFARAFQSVYGSSPSAYRRGRGR